MKRLLILALLASFPAHAQVRQSGAVTNGHIAQWSTNGVVQDGGSSANGTVNALGLRATGTPFCINDADPSSQSGYHQLCLGANSLGGGLLSYNNYGGAGVLPFQTYINGALVPYPPSTSTAVLLPTFANTIVYGYAYGMVCDASTDDTTHLQNAINAAVGGGTGYILQLPPGFCKVTSTLTITGGVTIVGAGANANSGALSGGTVIRATNLTTDVFAVATRSPVNFDGFQIDTTGGYGSAGAAISLTGSGGVGNSLSRITHMRIFNTYNGIRIDNAAGWFISDNQITDFANDGVAGLFSSTCQDGCGVAGGRSELLGNIFWDQNRGIANAGVEIRGGGDVEIIGNKFLNSAYGVLLNNAWGPTGTLLVSSNSIENQRTANVALLQLTSGAEYADVSIVGNEFLGANGQITLGTFYIGTGTPTTANKWIRNVVFSGNVFQDSTTNPTALVSILDGEGVTVSSNVIQNNNASGPVGIRVGAAATNVRLNDNNFVGLPSGFYGTIASSSVITTGPNSSGQWQVGNTGQGQFIVQPVANAVNYLDVKGGATGNGPQVNAAGSDTNVGIAFNTQGTGQYVFTTGGGVQAKVVDHAAADAAVVLEGGVVGVANARVLTTAGGLGLASFTGATVNTGTFTTSGALTVTTGGATISAGGLTVSASGITVTGNSTITGTLGGLTGLTVASGATTLTGVTTGTAAYTACLTSANVVIREAAPCTISSERFKHDIVALNDNEALPKVLKMRPVAFNRDNPDGVTDPNFTMRQLGLVAEEVATIDPRLGVYEQDGVTPKSYRPEAVIAVLIKAMQEQQAQINALKTGTR